MDTPPITTHGISRKIAAPPEQVYRYLTRPQELQMWLSEGLTCFEAHSGGVCVWTLSRQHKICGLVEHIEANRKIAIRAYDHRLEIRLQPAKNHTKVYLTLEGDGATLAAKAAWELALDNLESMLTTGTDLRTAHRPLLGVHVEAIEAGQPPPLNTTATHGLHITGLVPNTGTRQAGLQVDDILLAADQRPLHSRADLIDVLQSKQVGDVLQLDILRGENHQMLNVPLTARRLVELPTTVQPIITMFKEETARLMWLIAESCDSLSEQNALRRPAPRQWSVVEILAHMILIERDRRYRLMVAFVNSEPLNLQVNLTIRPERLQTVIAACGGLWGLLDVLRNEYEAAQTFIANLPQHRLNEPAYLRRFAEIFGYDTVHHHGEEHLAQIRDTIRAVQGSTSGLYLA